MGVTHIAIIYTIEKAQAITSRKNLDYRVVHEGNADN